jgi:uncharacterized SAM-binding protein YcdF (DUF218 family)
LKQRLHILLIVLALIGIPYLLIREARLILSVEHNAWVEDQRADCAVVLTGGPNRVREGFSLLTQKRVKKLIISGVNKASSLREIFPELPYYGNISEEDVLLEKRSNTTYGNAQQSQALIEALKCSSVILVTSRWHMYRAERSFKSILPRDIRVYPRTIVHGSIEPEKADLYLETLKSLFYSLWAYD